MKKKRNLPAAGGIVEINMTPMIDVVFQLIIFFMCLKLKTLDYKLDMNMPKTHGLNPTSDRISEPVAVKVTMRQAAHEGVPHISVFEEEIEPQVGLGAPLLPKIPRDADKATLRAAQAQHQVYWERNVAPKLAVLQKRLEHYVRVDKTLEYVIDAGPTVRHEFVVGVVDTLVAAGIKNVRFRGTRAPRAGQ